MRDSIHTTESEVIYIHAIRAYRHTKYKHACTHRTYTYLHSSAQHNSIYYHYCALIRAGYVLHSLECLKCGVVGKCCSNVLRSPHAYAVSLKAVHVVVRRTIQPTCVAHDMRFHSHNRAQCHIHPCTRACRRTKYKHVCIACTYA
jgi:hypothetical protein